LHTDSHGILLRLVYALRGVMLNPTNRLACLSVALFGLLGLRASGASALELSADQVNVKTPVYSPGKVKLKEGAYIYDVSWEGIPAAKATVQVRRVGEEYRLTATAKTVHFVDLFYKLRYHAEGVMSAADLSPLSMDIDQQENSRIKNTRVRFSKDGGISSVLEKNNHERPLVLKFKPGNFTLEPFSASVLARSLEWRPGMARDFDTFDGKSRYLVTLTCVKEEQIEVGGQQRKVWIIKPKVYNLNKGVPAEKLRSSEIMVSADEQREVLSIESEVFIGSVTTRLEKYVPERGRPDRIKIARLGR
jgi:hypothetical protein